MVKHNQLDVKGAPWQIQEERGKELVFQAGDIFFLGFLFSQFTTASALTGSGV